MKPNLKTAILTAAMGVLCASAGRAEPILQLYIEGATYDSSTETWVADFSSGDTLRVWTIGNISAGGGKGTISDVKLSMAYSSSDTPTVSIVRSTTGGYGGFTDPSLAHAATLSGSGGSGTTPTLGDGSPLPEHGAYGPGISWIQYSIGDFTVADALGGDFINSLPTPSAGYAINAYEITISGTDSVHFDLYDHIFAGNHAKAKFAPFSHDAGGGGNVPDSGSTLVLIGMGIALMGIGSARWKLRR